MRTIAFHQSAFDQYNDWALRDKKTFERLRRLIAEDGQDSIRRNRQTRAAQTRTLRVLVTQDRRRAPARL